MPLGDVTAKNAFLASYFGANHSTAAPSSFAVALFGSGVEITGGGYARVTVLNDATWPTPVDGKATVTVQFPTASGDWDEADEWRIFNGSELVANEPLAGTLNWTTGIGPSVDVTPYIPDAANASF